MVVIHSTPRSSIACNSSMSTTSGPVDLSLGIDLITFSISSFVNGRFSFSLLIMFPLAFHALGVGFSLQDLLLLHIFDTDVLP